MGDYEQPTQCRNSGDYISNTRQQTMYSLIAMCNSTLLDERVKRKFASGIDYQQESTLNLLKKKEQIKQVQRKWVCRKKAKILNVQVLKVKQACPQRIICSNPVDLHQVVGTRHRTSTKHHCTVSIVVKRNTTQGCTRASKCESNRR